MFRIALIAVMMALLPGRASAQDKAPAPISPEGRFLYADDDDWDWATPQGANQPCRLSVYGRMAWSALDWMEEGLPEVRGVLVGTPPASGNYLTMADLNRIRGAGPRRSYEQIQHKANILADLLADKRPPNLIIMMQDLGPPKIAITEKDVAAGLEFVRRGGRLIILDDWKCYRQLVSPFLDKSRFPAVKASAKLEPCQRKDAENLVHVLDSNVFRTREQAQAALIKMGPGVLSVLEAVKPKSLEQQCRIEKIIRVLRPAAPPVPGDDAWLAEAVQTAKNLHSQSEVRTISRNGQQQPGTALLLRLPVETRSR
jgi:hypothetical protein